MSVASLTKKFVDVIVKFVNLTPHEITIQYNKHLLRIPTSGKVARVKTKDVKSNTLDASNIGSIPIVQRSFGIVENLPEETDSYLTREDGTAVIERTIYLVSSIVLAVVPDRIDVAAPDTGDTAIRNADNEVVAVTRLIMNSIAFVNIELEGGDTSKIKKQED